jgi:hypothetical protein
MGVEKKADNHSSALESQEVSPYLLHLIQEAEILKSPPQLRRNGQSGISIYLYIFICAYIVILVYAYMYIYSIFYIYIFVDTYPNSHS